MKKRNEKGFFLVETMLVISVVAVVLLIVFKLFSSVYYGFLESENYNTVNSINALSNIQKYYESIGEIDTSVLSEENTYIELTNEAKYDSPYYTRIKEEYGITNIYLIDLGYFLNSNGINNFPVLFKRYLKTLKNIDGIAIVICTNGNEFSYVKLKDSVHITLNGDEEDEYGVYINVGGTFIDPGYTGWDGEEPQTEWENGKVLDTNVPGTYYLHYDFGGYLFRRKIEVFEEGYYDTIFSYTGSEQVFEAPHDGYYKVELWGAQGGSASSTYLGGYGGYSAGNVFFNKNDVLYINIGGKGGAVAGGSSSGGYNGGGGALSRSSSYIMGSGGGATHIAMITGILSSFSSSSSLESILIVAGGGGGAGSGSGNGSIGGSGGGKTGVVPSNSCTDCGTRTGGGQTLGGTGRFGTGSFGQGAGSTSTYSCGGGGGLYGGAGDTYEWGASGGSGYIGNPLLIDKYMYCYNCETSNEVDTKTYTTTCAEETPTENCAKIGDGYAKITFLGTNYARE